MSVFTLGIIMIYDLAVIGNGIFANVFLHEINKLVNKSQNFRVAKLYSEELAPNCSLRTTSTVSKNGIEEGISNLGDTLLNSYNAFENFFLNNKDCGIFSSPQYILSTDDDHSVRLERRYKNLITPIENNLFKEKYLGVTLNSYIVIPELFFNYLESFSKNYIQDDILQLVESIEESAGVTTLILRDKTEVKAKKVVIATGAYSRINTHLFSKTNIHEKILFTKVVAGSYLVKQFDYPHDLYFTINGHNLVYRHQTKEMIIGSTTVQGAIVTPDLVELKNIFDNVNSAVNLDLGSFDSYRVITGLRHKGQKRIPFFEPIVDSQNIWFFNGAYKNGWSLPFFYSKEKAKLFV